MNHTHFCNPTGLHDENHYTTVSDMAILLEALLEKEELRQIMSTTSHTSAPTNLHPEGLTYPSSMFEDMPGGRPGKRTDTRWKNWLYTGSRAMLGKFWKSRR